MDGSLFPDFEFFSQEEDVLLAVRETALMHPPRLPAVTQIQISEKIIITP